MIEKNDFIKNKFFYIKKMYQSEKINSIFNHEIYNFVFENLEDDNLKFIHIWNIIKQKYNITKLGDIQQIIKVILTYIDNNQLDPSHFQTEKKILLENDNSNLDVNNLSLILKRKTFELIQKFRNRPELYKLIKIGYCFLEFFELFVILSAWVNRFYIVDYPSIIQNEFNYFKQILSKIKSEKNIYHEKNCNHINIELLSKFKSNISHPIKFIVAKFLL